LGRPYVRLIGFLLPGTAAVPFLIYLSSRILQGERFEAHRAVFLLMLVAFVLPLALRPFLGRLEPLIDRAASRQAEFLHSMPENYLGVAIFTSAALSLFLELSIIRWQATVFELFALYKNFSLLACFAGLGLGYALGSRRLIPLFLAAPLFFWQFALLLGLRYGFTLDNRLSLKVLPFSEQQNMGLPVVNTLFNGIQTYFLLGLIFLLTGLAFVPIGQLCGCLLDRSGKDRCGKESREKENRDKLSAYGVNLAGSVAGVLLMFVLSAFWTPPVVWFLVAFGLLLAFHVWSPRPLLFGAVSVVLALIVVAWPADPRWQRIYSPYQLLEVGQDPQGLMIISASGHYYQRVHDLARSNRNVDSDPRLNSIRNYYELPYWFYGHAPGSVAVVGAGTGNDVAAGLRNGAEKIDAIEIDPAILMEGKQGHPEHPYSDPRVHAVVNDARTFLRSTNEHYDLVVYGLLDSHTLLSHASSVRLDSFVYTVEGLREARERLNPDGILSLSFSLMNPQLGHKIYLMLQDAFDGRAPVCVRAGYDGAVIFLEANNPDRRLQLSPALVQKTGFEDASSTFAAPIVAVNMSGAAQSVSTDVSTDDWPFFYMPRRVYPVSYVVMAVLVLALSLFMFSRFLDGRPQFGSAPFFFLGAGFMLIETKAITELGLLFGNSWQVVGIAIIGILVMAFLANWAVMRYTIERSSITYLLLGLSLAVGWWIAHTGGLPSSWLGRIGLATLLTSPMFFSGILFSTWLGARGTISGMMAMNLFGAMCGGLLEYNSMYFGFQFLYILAAGLYVLAILSESILFKPKAGPVLAGTKSIE
jgi:SAM-dependent methyltransferase